MTDKAEPNDTEVKAALRGLRMEVLDKLTCAQLEDLAKHLRRVADYADERAWVCAVTKGIAGSEPG